MTSVDRHAVDLAIVVGQQRRQRDPQLGQPQLAHRSRFDYTGTQRYPMRRRSKVSLIPDEQAWPRAHLVPKFLLAFFEPNRSVDHQEHSVDRLPAATPQSKTARLEALGASCLEAVGLTPSLDAIEAAFPSLEPFASRVKEANCATAKL